MHKSRLGLLWAAVLVALLAQLWMTPLGESRAFARLPKEHAPLGFALLLLAGLAVAVVMWLDDSSAREVLPEPREPGPLPIGGSFYGAVALGVIATGIAFLDVHSAVAIYPWAAGLAMLAFSMVEWGGPRPDRRDPMGAVEWSALFCVVGLAIAWRYPGLTEIPAQVHGDEAACGLEARRILHGEVSNLLGLGWYDIPNLSFALSALFMRVFGDDLFGLRMGSVSLGVASVALLHFTVRRLYGGRVAVLASVLLAISHWHVHFSRIGTDYMQASFASLLVLFFFVRARREARWVDWALSGMSVGLACSVYYAGRVVVVILIGFLLLERVFEAAESRRYSQGVTLMALATVLFVAPTLAVTSRLPGSFSERSRSVFLLSADNLEHSRKLAETATLPRLLGIQAVNSLVAFNWRGERSDQHGHPAPLLDVWSGPIFAIAIVGFTLVGWRRRYRMVVLWFWINLVLGSVLTVDAMFSPRMIVAVPAIFVFPALLVDRLYSLGQREFGRVGALVTGLAAIGFVAASAVSNSHDYFDLHVRELQPARRSTILSRFVRESSPDYRIYVYGRYSLRYDTPRFLVPDTDAVDMGDSGQVAPAQDGRGVAFVVDPEWSGRRTLVPAILEAYPDAERLTLPMTANRIAFEVYRSPGRRNSRTPR